MTDSLTSPTSAKSLVVIDTILEVSGNLICTNTVRVTWQNVGRKSEMDKRPVPSRPNSSFFMSGVGKAGKF